MQGIRSISHFIILAASAALFGILLLFAFMLTAPMGASAYLGFFRYDYLLLFAVIIQMSLIYLKLESYAEAKVIALFHLLAMVMEIFLTHPKIGSWYYPQPSIFKVFTVPLFAGFMYSAVGSFFARSIKLYQILITDLPNFRQMFCLSLLSYINFMSKFFIYDIRYFLFVWSIIIFAKTKVHFIIAQHFYRVPMLIVLAILAFLIWMAENISTFYNIWLYPTQIQSWHIVSWGKIGSWYLLLMLSLVLVLKIMGNRDTHGTWRIKQNLF